MSKVNVLSEIFEKPCKVTFATVQDENGKVESIQVIGNGQPWDIDKLALVGRLLYEKQNVKRFDREFLKDECENMMMLGELLLDKGMTHTTIDLAAMRKGAEGEE